MRRLTLPLPRFAALTTVLIMVAYGTPPAVARDLGQLGTVFPIVEPDLLGVIEARLLAAQSSGKIARMQQHLASRTVTLVKRPPPVAGLGHARERRSWAYDPTITVDRDIPDGRGHVIIAHGARVNPLDTVSLRQSLVFLDGDDAGQVAWAVSSTSALNAKLILTSGSPFDLMKARQRRFFFDQGGKLVAKFGIAHTPAVVEQDGRVLRVTELPVVRGRGGV